MSDKRIIGQVSTDSAESSATIKATIEGSRAGDPTWFRRVMGCYPTGVCVVTAESDDGDLFGMTIGSFTSVSLSPPLIAFFPDKTSTTWPRIAEVGRFCVNVLAGHQSSLCRSMAARGQDRFKDVAFRRSPRGAIIVEGAAAWIECVLHDQHEAGDHFAVYGRVEDLDMGADRSALVFFKGAMSQVLVEES
jgi:flavin reductase (DIM6/NTAB) family NADH-FMN oxidoreductase RutF